MSVIVRSLIRLLLTSVMGLCMLTACVSSPTPTSDTQRYKLFVAANGLYRVTGAELQSAGAAVEKIDPAALQLFRDEREIAIRVSGAGRDLAIEFYGLASDSPYSAFNVYWLRWNVQHGLRMRESASAEPTQPPVQSFSETVSVSQPTLYVPQAGGLNQHWFWQSLAAPLTTSVNITLSAALPSSAQLRVNLWGSTQDEATPDHHLQLFFNDARIADESWDGAGAHVIDATIPATLVREGVNAIRLIAPGDTAAKADITLLSSINITYTRRLVAQGDVLEFVGGAGAYRVEGFGSNAVEVFDIGDPDAPIHLTNATVGARAVSFSTVADTPRRWLAIGPTARRSVARISPMPTTNLRSANRQADYIVITPSDFVPALQPLVRWREQHGLKLSVVTTDEIYDEFGYGRESPMFIRDFLAHAYRQWTRPAPRFVLLVGKASYDTRNYLSAPNKNLLPSFLRPTLHLGETGIDNFFVAFGESPIQPYMAIGRLPVKTPTQLTTIIDKMIAYESAADPSAWRRRALFVADDKDGEFEDMSEDFIRSLPAGTDAARTYLRANDGALPPTKQSLIDNWNQGAWLVSYVGHGSIDTWAAGPLFKAADVSALHNGERLPFMLTPTCLDGFFLHPQQDSLAEQLLLKKDGGIIAGLVPTGLSLPYNQRKLVTAFFSALFASHTPTVGEAILQAKQSMPVPDEADGEVIETFTLLGDPALRLALGK